MTLWSDRFKKNQQHEEELPPELKDKTPAEVVAELKRLDAAAQDAEAKRVAMETERSTQQTEFERMKARVAELEANGGQHREEEHHEEEPASPWIDPVKFVQDTTKETSAVALASGIMSAKMYAMQQLTSRDAKIFKKYEAEIEKVVTSFAPVQRVMPQTWMNALIYTKGLHDQDIQKAESEGTDFFAERGTEGRHQQDDHQESVTKLTADEEEVCKRFHYDPKKYLANKQAATLKASEKGQYASYVVPTTQNRD